MTMTMASLFSAPALQSLGPACRAAHIWAKGPVAAGDGCLGPLDRRVHRYTKGACLAALHLSVYVVRLAFISVRRMLYPTCARSRLLVDARLSA